MTLVPDEQVLAPALVAEHREKILGIAPGTSIESDGHDLLVEIPHAGTRMVGDDVAKAMARAVRGGRDIDAGASSDWHVQSRRLILDIPVLAHLAAPGPPKPLGTRIWLSRSYRAPEHYRD